MTRLCDFDIEKRRKRSGYGTLSVMSSLLGAEARGNKSGTMMTAIPLSAHDLSPHSQASPRSGALLPSVRDVSV